MIVGFVLSIVMVIDLGVSVFPALSIERYQTLVAPPVSIVKGVAPSWRVCSSSL